MKQNLLLFHLIYQALPFKSKIRLGNLYGYVLALLFILGFLPTASAQLTKVWETPPFKHSSGAGAGFVRQQVDQSGNLIILGSGLTQFKYDATGKQLWATQFDAGAGASQLQSRGLWLDEAGNSYVLGQWYNSSSVYEDALLKYGPAGNLLWSKVFTNTPGSMVRIGTLALDSNDNIYLTGNMNDSGVSVMATQKLSAAGQVQWTSKATGFGSGQVITVDNKGSVFVLTSSSTIVSGYESIILFKYDAETGAELMQKLFSTPRIPGYIETPKKLLLTKAGEIYVIVGTSSGSSGVLKIFLHKIAPDGTLIYKNQIGQTDAAVLYDAVFTTNEDILFLCREQKYRTTWDHFITKVNADGQHVWLHKFNVYEADNMVRYFAPSSGGLALKADGSIAIAGSYSRFRIPPFSSYEEYTEFPKFILATFNTDGVETWRQVMDHHTSREGSSGISFKDSKSLYFTGSLRNTSALSTPVDLVAMKFTDCNGFTASAGQDKEICTGGSVQLQASGGTTYTWAPATGLSATNIANPVAAPAATTTYTVTVTNADGCTATDEVVVKVNQAPAATITANGTTTFCTGGSVILTANSGTGYTYQWLKNGVAIEQATGTTFTASISGDYAVLIKSNSGCTATAAPVKVTVTSGVTASAGADAEFCAGNSVQLQASGGTTYAWAPATGLSATNIANPTASPATTTTYTVTVSNANGCTATDQVVVRVNPAPAATITPAGATTFCEGGSLVLNANQGSGYTYQWFKDGNPINQATGSSFTTFASGAFTVRISNSSGCSTTSAAVNVTVNRAATVNAGSSQSVCANAAAFNLSGYSPEGGTWSGTGVSGAGVFNPATAGVGTHTLTYTVTQNNCTATATKTVTVTQAVATPGAITGNATICAGTSDLTYTINAVSGAQTYTWSVPAGFTITAGQGTTSINVTAGNSNGSITVTAGNNCGTSASSSLAINVSTMPAATITTEGNTTFCEGGSVTLKAPAGNNYTYQWLRNGTAISGATAASFSATTAGNYTVQVTNGNCSKTSSAVAVNVTNAISNNTVASGSQAVCAGTTTTLQGSTPAGGAGTYTYQWEQSTNGTDFTAIQGAGTQNHNPGNLNATTWFRRKVTAGGCSSTSAAVKITVNAAPQVSLSAFTKMCTDDDALTLTGGQPAGGVYSGTGVANGTFNPATAGAGNHTITYTFTDANGCAATATQTIEVAAECSVTGVEDEEPPHKFVLFPNPAKDRLHIEVEVPERTDILIKLVDVRGRTIVQQDYTGFAGSFKAIFDLGTKARGMYFLQFTTKEGTYNRKVLLW